MPKFNIRAILTCVLAINFMCTLAFCETIVKNIETFNNISDFEILEVQNVTCNETSPCDNITADISVSEKVKPKIKCKYVNVIRGQIFLNPETNETYVEQYNMTFDQNNYRFSENSKTNLAVCYPFSRRYLTCKKWVLFVEHYELEEYGGSILSLSSYENISLGEYEVLKDSKVKVCMPKCKYVEVTKGSAVPINEENDIFVEQYNMTFTAQNYRYSDLEKSRVSVCYPYTDEYQKCSKWDLNQEEFKVLDDGTMYVSSYGRSYGLGEYTLRKTMVKICRPGEQHYDNVAVSFDNIRYTIYFVCWFISDISLLFVFILYLLRPRLNHFTKGLLCHIASLFLAYLFLIISEIGEYGPKMCIFLAIGKMWSFLVSFYWLNILAFDLFWNFSGYEIACINCESKGLRFGLYFLYSVLTPTLIVLTTALLDHHTEEIDFSFRARFEDRCWFNNHKSQLLFFYGPAAFLFCCNSLFFTLTILALRKAGRAASLANRKLTKQLLRVYVKLFVVMGMCWIFEVLSVLFDKYERYFFPTDILNSLQGFFILLVYTFKREVIRDIRNKILPSFRIYRFQTADGPHTTYSTRTSSCKSENNAMANRISDPNDKRKSNNKKPLSATSSVASTKI